MCPKSEVVEWISPVTETVRGSNPRSLGHIDGRRELAVVGLVTTRHLM